MVGKNNLKYRLEQNGNKVQRFTIKKFSVGVASVAVGTMLLMPNSVNAEESVEPPVEEGQDIVGDESSIEVEEEELVIIDENEAFEEEQESESDIVGEVTVGQSEDEQTDSTGDAVIYRAETNQEQVVVDPTPAQVEDPVQTVAPEVYDVATHKERSVEGITPEGAEEIRVYLPGDSEVYRTANILSENPFTGARAFRLVLPEEYAFEAGQEVRVTAVDEFGNESEATVQTVIDSEAVAQLTVDPIYPGDTTISGTVNPDAQSVQIYLPNGAMVSGTIQDDGTWSANLFSNTSQLTPGETVDVRVRIDGNTHRFDGFTVQLEAPEVYDVATHKERSVEGITPEGAEEIRVYLPGDSEEYRTANILSENPFTGARAFRLVLPEGYAFEAGQEVRVTAVDEFGNESEATVQTVIDSEAVAQLTVDPIHPGDTTISGTVNPDAQSVQIYLPNGAMVSGTIQDDGTWSANLFSNASQLTPGETVDVRVRMDENTHRFDGFTVQLEAPEVYDVATHKERSVEGITPEGAEEIRVYLPGDSEEYRTANILSENPFTGARAFRLVLPEGYAFEAGQEVRVTAVDEFGNESEATVQTVIDSEAVAQLTVNPIHPGDTTISGTVNPDAQSVQIYLPNGAMVSGTIQNDGTWSANLFSNASQLTPGETVDVRVRIDGNTHRFDGFTVEIDLSPLVDLIAEAEAISNADEQYTEESFANLEFAIAEARAALDTIETEEELVAAMNALQAAMDNLVTVEEAAWNDLLDRIDDLENQLADLADTNEELRAEIERLRAELAALLENQNDMEDRIEELENRIDELEERVEELESRDDPADQGSSEDPEDPQDPTQQEEDVDNADEESEDSDENDEQKLPQTGAASSSVSLVAGILSVLSGLGLMISPKSKRKE